MIISNVPGSVLMRRFFATQKKEKSYYVRFDDDENALRRIPVEMVVEMP